MLFQKQTSLWLTLGALSLGFAAYAGEFPVATYTDRAQLANAVVFNPVSEEFLVTWSSHGSSGEDDWDFSIQARRFDSGGIAIGDQFQVNAFSPGRQRISDVAVDAASGDFVVVWKDYQPSNGVFAGLKWRRFASDGTPLTEDVQVTPEDVESQVDRPSVESLPSGGFLISWLDTVEFNTTHVLVQRYADNGVALGSAFQVNQDPLAGRFSGPSVAVDSTSGEFLVVWNDREDAVMDNWQIEGRSFTSTGTPLGDTFVVAGTETVDFRMPSVAFEPQSETFVVAWVDWSGLDGDEMGLMMGRVLADGTLLGDATLINTTTARDQLAPKVITQTHGGDFEVVWVSETRPGSDDFQSNVRARRFTSEGIPLGQDFQVGVFDRPGQGAIVAAIPTPPESGLDPQPFYFWSAWRPCGDDSDLGVTAFYAPVPTDPCELGLDGFESGDFDGWSAVVGQ